MPVITNIRLARPSDAGPIAEMSRRYIEHGLQWSWKDGRVLRAIHDQATNVVVIPEGGEIVGFGIMQYAEDAAHLALFAVQPVYRHRGLGSFLLSWLEKPAGVAGLERIHVEARADNAAAIAFYQRHGYAEVSRFSGYYQGILDAVRFEKRL